MKKRIIALVSCVFVLVAALSVGVAADHAFVETSYWRFLFDNRNREVNVNNVDDLDVEVNRTPDIYFTMSEIPDHYNANRMTYAHSLPVVIESDYFNVKTGRAGTHRFPAATVDIIAFPSSDEELTFWRIDVKYITSATAFTIYYQQNLDASEFYWYTSYMPDLQFTRISFKSYLHLEDGADVNVPADFVFRDDVLKQYCDNEQILFPYVAGDYGAEDLIEEAKKEGALDGYNNGYQFGYDEGFKEGKRIGAASGEGWMNFKNLIFMIFDAPFYVLSTALNFEVFGINIAGTLIGLISLALIVWILKIIIVRLF